MAVSYPWLSQTFGSQVATSLTVLSLIVFAYPGARLLADAASFAQFTVDDRKAEAIQDRMNRRLKKLVELESEVDRLGVRRPRSRAERGYVKRRLDLLHAVIETEQRGLRADQDELDSVSPY